MAAEEGIMRQLTAATTGPVDCDPVSLCIGNQSLLSIFLYNFIVSLRKKNKKIADDVSVNLRFSDDEDPCGAAGTYKGQ